MGEVVLGETVEDMGESFLRVWWCGRKLSKLNNVGVK